VILPAQYGVAVPVDPGDRNIKASAPGRTTYNDVVSVTRGSIRFAVPLLTELPATTDNAASSLASPGNRPAAATSSAFAGPSSTTFAADSATSRGYAQRVAAFSLGGAGLVGLGVGTYYGLSAIARNSQSKADCPSDPNLCTSEGVTLRHQALSDARVSTVGFIAGGALIAAGTVLFLSVPNGQSVSVSVPAAFTNHSVQLGLGGDW
jgi:serine/threonine-protein kinase